MTRPETPALILSQNEVESLALKAARGAGFSWGLAEEAGAAMGWLAAQGIDGLPILLTLLTTPNRASPIPAPGHWTSATGAPLCPIETGAALLDRARLPDGAFAGPLHLGPVACPLVLLPFLARSAALASRPLRLMLPDAALAISAQGQVETSEAARLLGTTPQTLTLAPTSDAAPPPAAPAALPAVALTALAALEALALATTVPASATSRFGAGSELSDND